MWQPQIQDLSGEYYCLAPDLPGHANSAQIRPFSLQTAVVEVTRLIEESLGNQRAYIVGLSIGAAVGLELLRMRPEMIDRAILSGATPKLGRGLMQVINAMNSLAFRLLPRRYLAKATIRSLSIPAPYQAAMIEDFQAIDNELLLDVNRATGEIQMPQRAVPPTLVVVGEREPRISKRYAWALCNTIEGTTGKIVAGAGHAWNLEWPDLFNQMVRAWFAGAPLPARLLPLE
jgi:pimeloyl-ACP methyl ester carboxylesterase